MKTAITFILSMLFSVTMAQEWKVNIGDKTPAFEVTNKAGEKITNASLEGKVVLLNFFATWCPPCRAELPELQKQIWDTYGQREDFEVMVLGREEGWDKIDPFVKENGYTFPFYPDLNRAVFGLFAENSIPRNVILDRSGKIIYQSIGYTPAEFGKMVELIGKELQK